MKIKKIIGERFKENPSNCFINSHALLIRGGYIKYVSNGIYSKFTPLIKIYKNIENIIKKEMNNINGQEVQFPIIIPASFLKQSNRYYNIGKELIKFNDRNNNKMVIGMTHEESAVQFVNKYAKSYTKYPFMIYQIQTKFRDEIRPRAGLIRLKEFKMKDAYSFHTSIKDLKKYYNLCYNTYKKIFTKVGILKSISVMSNSGIMGGNLSHEFILLTDIGEDSIIICNKCGFKTKNINNNKICPKCNTNNTYIYNGIEIGNIFQLGTKYTKSMNMQYIDKNGKKQYPLMGCYGIGIDRLVASICEANHDKYGPIWPITISPWTIHLCCIRSDNKKIKKISDKIYNKFKYYNIKILYDNRNISAGVMFYDADLFGIPIRIIISPKNIKQKCCEIITRNKKIKIIVKLNNIINKTIKLIKILNKKYYNI